MRTLTYVKTAFASILLTSSAAVWASAPTKFVTNSSNTASFTSPIAVTTTTPEASGHPAYVVAAAADQNQDLEVIAWHDQTLVQAPTIGVEQFTTLGVSITGLDASRVVTASISNSELAITTWSVSTAGVAYQNMYSTSKNYPYEEVSITAISSSQVVAVFRDALGPFAVEEFTINAEGVPTQFHLSQRRPMRERRVVFAYCSDRRHLTLVAQASPGSRFDIRWCGQDH